MRMAGVWSQRPDALERDFEFDDFAGAMAFVNRVAEAAEEANHHPDILVHGWNKVRLTLSTHSEGGLTDNDPRPGATHRRPGFGVAACYSRDVALDARRRPLPK
jgi:4a-hydroxytetrahydrobiopterin dehydratase